MLTVVRVETTYDKGTFTALKPLFHLEAKVVSQLSLTVLRGHGG